MKIQKIDRERIFPTACLIILIVFAVSGAVWPEPPKQPQQEQQATTRSMETGSENIRVEIAEETVARYTIVLAWFTGVLAVGTLGLLGFSYSQSRDTKKSIELASKEFISTHRPRIIVRDVFAVPSEGNPIEITYSLVNSGESDAWIVESAMEIEFPKTAELMLIPDSKNGADVTDISEPLKAGELRRYLYTSPHIKWSADDLHSFHADINLSVAPEKRDRMEKGLFFSGRLVYVDAAKTSRQIAFRHRYHKGKQRFYPFGDAELEYAD